MYLRCENHDCDYKVGCFPRGWDKFDCIIGRRETNNQKNRSSGVYSCCSKVSLLNYWFVDYAFVFAKYMGVESAIGSYLTA